MSNKVEPTEKQKRAFKEIVENGSNKKDAMIKAGYSKNTAIAPTKMTETKGWEKLMEEHIPDDLLSKVHNEGLEAVSNKKPDFGVRHKYLDTAYKLKGKYAPEKKEFMADKVEEELKDKKTNEV